MDDDDDDGSEVEEGEVRGKLEPGKWHVRSNTRKPWPGSWRFLEPTDKEGLAFDQMAGGAMPKDEEEYKQFVFRNLQANASMAHYIAYCAAQLFKVGDQNSRMISQMTEMNRRMSTLEKTVEGLRSKVGGPIVETAGRKLLPIETEKPGDTPEMQQKADDFILKVSNGYV
jgi:hypothetical protein